AAWGAALLFGATIFGELVPSKPPAALANLVPGIVHGATALLGLYAAHSGLAHLQIGLCRTLGYRAPERYRYPFLATGPADFWERWNTYMMGFVRSYVFVPVHRALKRRSS